MVEAAAYNEKVCDRVREKKSAREEIEKNSNLLISINLQRCKHFCLRATTCVAFHYYIWIIIMCHTGSIQVSYRIFISFFPFSSVFIWEIFVDSIWIQHVNTFYFVQPFDIELFVFIHNNLVSSSRPSWFQRNFPNKSHFLFVRCC